MRALKNLATLAASLLLACCSASTSSSLAESKPSVRPGSPVSLLQRVRSAGQVGDELDVQPLRDPRAEDLRSQASAAEVRGDYATATNLLAQAAKYTPEDPDLLQWQAEMALVGKDWSRAGELASQSWQQGPKLGGLCRRNWTTLQLVAESRGDAAAAAQAQQRVAACTVPPPNRY
jgi:Flp pilus assembly protein TadD